MSQIEPSGESSHGSGESNGSLTHSPTHDVQAMREACGISQRQLSEKTGIAQKTLSRIERGEAQPTAGQLTLLAIALDAKVTELPPPATAAHAQRAGVRRVFVCLSCRRRTFLPRDPFHGGTCPGDFVPDCSEHGPMVRQANHPYMGQSTEPLPEQGWPPAIDGAERRDEALGR